MRAKRTSESGQILILFVFFFVMIAGIILISANVGVMAKRRMELQVAADAGAMAGARMQALGLGFMTDTNDIIAYRFGRLVADLFDPLEWPDAIVQLEHILKLKALQDKVFYAMLGVVDAAVLLTSGTSAPGGVIPIAVPVADVSVPELKVQNQWWTLFLFKLREASGWGVLQVPGVPTKVEEKITAIAVVGKTKMVGGDFLGMKLPAMAAIGSAKPYWVIWGDPRSESMDGGASILSLLIPGPFWSTRLVETGNLKGVKSVDQTVEGVVNLAFQIALDKATDKVTEEIAEKIVEKLEDAIANEVPQEIEMVSLAAEEEAEEAID